MHCVIIVITALFALVSLSYSKFYSAIWLSQPQVRNKLSE